MAVILFKMDKDKGLIEERFDSADINIKNHDGMGWCVSPERAREVYELNKPSEPTIEKGIVIPENINISNFKTATLPQTYSFDKPKRKPGPKPKVKVEDNAGQSEI